MKLLLIGKTILTRFFAERFFDQSAQMAYYFLLSLFPFLLFIVSVISFFPLNMDDILTVVRPYAPANTYVILQDTLNSVLNAGHGKLLSFSLVATFWLASMAIQSLVRSLNDAYQVKRKQGFIKGLILDLLLTVGFMLIVPLSLFIPIAEKLIQTFVISHVKIPASWYDFWFYVRWGFGSMFLLIFFLFLYFLVPSIRLKFRYVIPGAIFAAVGWQVVSIGFSYYVGIVSYSRIYGQLGSVIILMVWFYLTAVVLLIGGLLNASIYRRKEIIEAKSIE